MHLLIHDCAAREAKERVHKGLFDREVQEPRESAVEKTLNREVHNIIEPAMWLFGTLKIELNVMIINCMLY